mgnify:FL=1
MSGYMAAHTSTTKKAIIDGLLFSMSTQPDVPSVAKEKTPKYLEGNKYPFVGVYFVEGGILILV